MNHHYYHLLKILLLAILPASLMAQPAQVASDSISAAKDSSAASTHYPTAAHHNAKESKTVAIICSFSQDTPWSNDYIPPVTAAASSNANTYCDVYFLQSLRITDSIAYNQVKESLFDYYREKKPDYVVMIGKMAFSMRDEMIKEWGDIPMFLIANSADLAPLDYYFSGTERGSEAEVVQKGKIFDMQKKYNFTALIIPYLYRQTVELMVETMRGDINEIVFVAVPTYIERNNSRRLARFLAENYPGIQYRWLNADNENVEELRSLLIEPHPGTGILLSNWAVVGKSPFGDIAVINQESKLLSSSVNPVFVASASMINNGAVGGVFLNKNDINKRIDDIMDAMLSGKDLRKIPIHKCDKETAVINYERAKQYGLKVDGLNEDVVFEGRPLSVWDEFHWHLIIGAIILLLFGVLVWKRNKSQAKEIELLQLHRKFVEAMPIAYGRATLYLSQDGKHVNNVVYSDLNDAMQNLVSQNGCRTGEYVLFPISFISGKAHELFEKEHKIDFVYHFENTDTDYDIFIDFSAGDGTHKNNNTVRELDIFAVDVTNRVKMEKELKDLSRRLDLTINVTGIIPWEWDIKNDVLKFDAYSLFGRQLHDVEDMKSVPSTYLDVVTEFMPLVHPDDKPKLEENTRYILSKEHISFTQRYRLHVVRNGMDVYQWVEIRGRITEYDSKGNPKKVNGGMWRLIEDDMVDEPVV